MRYDLSDKYQQLRFKERVNKLYKLASKVELKVIRKTRTFKQNRYLHVILTNYGLELGYTLEDVKQDIFKRNICKEDFIIIKNNKSFYKSTRDLDTKEMTIAIERFRNHRNEDCPEKPPSRRN